MTVSPLMQDTLLRDGLLVAFETRAVALPGDVAVIAGNASLAAGELNERANRLARQLQNLGARPGTYIGIGLSRSVELIVALLAVVKSGAAYVPLDPAYPQARLAHMISSAGLDLVLSRGDLAETFRSAGAANVVDVL